MATCGIKVRNKAYAKCWKIEPGRGNFTKVRMSVSRRNKETGEYEQDFSGFVMMIGNAHAMCSKLKEGDRIRLGEVDVSNRFDKERNREFIDYKCFSFEIEPDTQAGTSDPDPVETGEESEEETPF